MKAWLPLDHDCGPNNGLRSMPHKRANRRARCVGACSVPARSHPAHKAAFDASRRAREDEAKAQPPAPSGSLTITCARRRKTRVSTHDRDGPASGRAHPIFGLSPPAWGPCSRPCQDAQDGPFMDAEAHGDEKPSIDLRGAAGGCPAVPGISIRWDSRSYLRWDSSAWWTWAAITMWKAGAYR